MSVHVCYISRSDRGGRLTGVRLSSGHAENVWEAPRLLDAPSVIDQAAAWIKERLGGSRRLGALCVDVDGGVCSWVSADEPDPQLVRAIIEGAGPADAAGELDGEMGGVRRFPDLPGETTIEPLGEPKPGEARRQAEPSTGTRLATLSLPDVPARLLLDRLDALGVRVDRVVTLWHALAGCWDPDASDPGGRRADRVVATSEGPAAVVAIDADSGRLAWSWSADGALLAAGSMRLAHRHLAGPEHDEPTRHGASVVNGGPSVHVTPSDVGRLTGDWLSWSAQLGIRPGRIVVVGEPAGGNGTLDLGGLGTALAKRWDVPIDLIGGHDAIGATLARLTTAPAQDGPRRQVAALTDRPGRAHRSMFRWSAAALFGLAVAIGAAAFQILDVSGANDERVDALRQQRFDVLNAFDPTLAVDPFPTMTLRSAREMEEQASRRPALDEQLPVLAELETVALVVGHPGVELREITIGSVSSTVTARVPDLKSAEDLERSLKEISGSRLLWFERSITDIPARNEQPRQIEAKFTAVWAGRGGGEGG